MAEPFCVPFMLPKTEAMIFIGYAQIDDRFGYLRQASGDPR
jgi:hypothetical protein